jgi:hypothetical protein
MRGSRRHILAIGLAIIAATNAVALLGAAWNRQEPPESTLRLSERELLPPSAYERRDNSGLALRLRWRVLGMASQDPYLVRMDYGGGAPEWLDRAKMQSLGFDVSLPDDDLDDRRIFRRQLGREVFVVLELDGPTYARSLERAAAAAERLRAKGGAEEARAADQLLEREKDVSSRLFVVDAGLDAAALRAKYADRALFAIAHGLVEPAGGWTKAQRPHSGYVSALGIDTINVPLEFRAAFEGAVPETAADSHSRPRARYEATLSYGKRLEPWLASATRK